MSGAIFDVDGTLLDSMGVWYNVTENYFRLNGKPLDPQIGALFQNMTLTDSTSYMHNVLGFSDKPEQVLNNLEQMIAVEYEQNIPLKPYAEEYIRSLYKNGVRLAVATSGYARLWRSAFDRLGILKYFDAAAFSSEVGVDKSNPDVYLLAAERLGKAPCECTVYEDILTGIIGAKKAGMRTVGIYDESNENDTEEIIKHADIYVKDYSELF